MVTSRPALGHPLEWLGLVGIVLLLTACATFQNAAHEEGMTLVRQGAYDQGVARLEQAVREQPQNGRFRIDLVNARTNYVGRLVALAAHHRAQGRLDEARALYQKALAVDPISEQVKLGLDELARDQRHARAIDAGNAALKKGDIVSAASELRTVLAENPGNRTAQELKNLIEDKRARELMAGPQLEAAFRKPVSLEFRDASLATVFDALSRSTGINYILDKDIRPELKTTVSARMAPLEDAIDLILMTNQLRKKILSPNSILIYPATPQKLREYEDLVIKAFYLTSADPKIAQGLLKSVIKIREVFIDEKLKLLVIRDTPEAVRLAEKLIALHDLGDPEVMLEVEVLEVRRSRLLELGIQFPDQLVLTPLPSAVGGALTLNDLRNLSASRTGAAIPSTIINLRRQDGDVNLLANPRVRAKNREKARVLIGERVPVITTTAGATGFVAQNVQYLDVGLKLEIEPDIQVDNEIVMKVALEVSSITREIVTASGLLTYQIGTRTAATGLRLKDGETQILAGLINDEDRQSGNRVPGLGDLPLIGRLFGSKRDDLQKTEIVLSITPRLIRGMTRPTLAAAEFWSGTETAIRTRPLSLASIQPSSPSVSGSAPVASTAAAGLAALSWRGPDTVRVGQDIKIDVLVRTDAPIRGLPMQLAFDPGVFEVVEIQQGSFFKQGGAEPVVAHNIDRTAGRIFIGSSATSPTGVRGNDVVVSIIFRGKAQKAASEIQITSATPIAAGGAASTTALALPQAKVISISP